MNNLQTNTTAATTTTEISGPTKKPCKDAALGNLTSRPVMEANGWVFNVTHSDQEWSKERCGHKTWFGLSSMLDVGSVSTTFKGSGNATLGFGNCWNSYKVTVSLDGEELARATGNQLEETVSFNFTKDSEIKIEEDGSIIKLNYLNVSCD